VNFEHAAHVAAGPDAVFALTQDYARRLMWAPFLSRAELVGGASRPGVGVRAWWRARGSRETRLRVAALRREIAGGGPR
jgi:hypothetical protein